MDQSCGLARLMREGRLRPHGPPGGSGAAEGPRRDLVRTLLPSGVDDRRLYANHHRRGAHVPPAL